MQRIDHERMGNVAPDQHCKGHRLRRRNEAGKGFEFLLNANATGVECSDRIDLCCLLDIRQQSRRLGIELFDFRDPFAREAELYAQPLMLMTFVAVFQNLSAFLWARRLNSALSARLRESLAKQDSKLVHR